MGDAFRYVVVTPVKDEERYIAHTLRSMSRQDVKPVLWVIVDDGSRDRTLKIIERYRDSHPFIRLVHHTHAGVRKTGAPVVRAFNYGYAIARGVPHDFVVKLDGDMSFGPDYFKRLLAAFAEDRTLGIASGVYFEPGKSGKWREISMPAYHAAGACKVMRRECFEQIGGFVPEAGWDTVDEIRAMARGWRTTHFRDLHMKHYKPEGTGIGRLKTYRMHGEIYFRTGGGFLFFMFKVLKRLGEKPFVIGALALLHGFLNAGLKRKKPLVTENEALCYSNLLNGRLHDQLKRFSNVTSWSK